MKGRRGLAADLEILTTAISAKSRASPRRTRIGRLQSLNRDSEGAVGFRARGVRFMAGIEIGRARRARSDRRAVVAAGKNRGPVFGLRAAK